MNLTCPSCGYSDGEDAEYTWLKNAIEELTYASADGPQAFFKRRPIFKIRPGDLTVCPRCASISGYSGANRWVPIMEEQLPKWRCDNPVVPHQAIALRQALLARGGALRHVQDEA